MILQGRKSLRKYLCVRVLFTRSKSSIQSELWLLFLLNRIRIELKIRICFEMGIRIQFCVQTIYNECNASTTLFTPAIRKSTVTHRLDLLAWRAAEAALWPSDILVMKIILVIVTISFLSHHFYYYLVIVFEIILVIVIVSFL
jgi:hypothetical protein